MAEENENRVPKEERKENNTTPEVNNASADSGRDPDELRNMIDVLSKQIETLTKELHVKDPEGTTPKADFSAYFKDFMK